MRKAQKQQAEELVSQMEEAHAEIKKHISQGSIPPALALLEDCQSAAVTLGTLIERTEGEGHPTVSILEGYCELAYQVYKDLSDGDSGKINADKIHKLLRQKLLRAENSIKHDIRIRQEVVFLPYKASMWDSLESVWRAADADEDCDAYVVPIPYYDKDPDGSFREEHYEGGLYPKDVPVTRYDRYDFEKRRPDVIYIHNAYDDWNLVTSIHPHFFSRNLKKYTDRLVYIPYFVLNEVDPGNGQATEHMKHFCFLPGIINADKVIVQSEDMKKIYINEFLKAAREHGLQGKHQDRAYLEQKFLGIGSPKYDKVIAAQKEGLEIPQEWLDIIQKPDGSRKKIILYNTGIAALLAHNEKWLDKIEDVLETFRLARDGVVLLWRPHPLLESTMRTMRPAVLERYQTIKEKYLAGGWGIYDDTADVDRAIVLSDAYYGDMSSVVKLYQQTGKPVMVQDVTVTKW